MTDWNGVANDVVFLYQRPYFNYFNSVATSMNSSTTTQITLGGTTTSGYGFSVSSNNVIVPLTGTYWVSAAFAMNTTTGSLQIFIRQNGATVALATFAASSATGTGSATITTLVSCSAGDTLGLFGLQNTGGAVSTNTGPSTTFLSGFFVGSQ